ncbi:fimbrial protein [Pseudomonas sp. S191]|uniref:fimbrial protein n=1 Tax=Pseudomonas sp. S191 TaxID=579575 RepID=UPI00387B781D
MKNSMLSAAVALAFSAMGSMPAFAANDGVINFTGSVTSVTCKVEVQAPGANGATKDVELDGVPASNLAVAKKVANLKGFSIVVGGAGDSGCTNGTNALVRFDPSSPAIDVASGNLNVDGWDKPEDTTTAKNVQIQLTKQDGTPINAYNEQSDPVVIADNTAVINLGAQYYATGAASAGAVATRVGYMVVYAD